MSDIVKQLEERMSVLEFKLELVLKLTKNDLDITLANSKTMIEFAYVMNLKKDEFDAIDELLSTQIKFYQSFKQKSYISPRQIPKIEQELDVFIAFSKEEFENAVWKCIPKLLDNHEVCEKIAKINGIHELYYGELANAIKKEKHERLDKEAKLLNSYTEKKDEIVDLFDEFDLLKQELQYNLARTDEIIEFFEKNELIKISEFYNGELWDLANDDKKVVINENTYIQNVCQIERNDIIDKFLDVLKDKERMYRELFIHILKSGPTSSKKLDKLKSIYKTMNEFNKHEHVHVNEIKTLKESLQEHIAITDEILNSFNEYVSSVEK